jgi:hypothetical protein
MACFARDLSFFKVESLKEEKRFEERIGWRVGHGLQNRASALSYDLRI